MPHDPARLVEHLGAMLPADWTSGPPGWPGEIEAALIDSVMGIRATYGSPTTGVRAAVARWREHEQARPLDDLARLADVDEGALAAVLANRQRLTGGAAKTAGITQAAARLLAVGVRHADDLHPDDPAHREAYVGVTGLGEVTWQYLALMLGVPGRDAAWLAGFASDALGVHVSATGALELVEATAESLGTDATRLLRAVWTVRRR